MMTAINELSKKTLGNYLKKAVGDVEHTSKATALARRDKFDNDYRKDHYAKVEKRTKDTVDRRRKGIVRAVDKLTKESNEMGKTSINELSKKTLGQYVDNANHNLKGLNYKGNEIRKSYDAANHIGNQLTDKAARDSLNHIRGEIRKEEDKNLHKSMKRKWGTWQAMRRLTKESAKGENGMEINELSRKTLSNYVAKANDSMQSLKNRSKELRKADNATYEITPHLNGKSEYDALAKVRKGIDKSDKANNRKQFSRGYGLHRALKKLAKESTNGENGMEINELSKKTLGRYIKKANNSMINLKRQDTELTAADEKAHRISNHIKTKEGHAAIKTIQKELDKNGKYNWNTQMHRGYGIHTALKKLTKESIDSFIENAIDNNIVGAQDDFKSAISEKISDALEYAKEEIASDMYGQEDIMEEGYDYSDEELDSLIESASDDEILDIIENLDEDSIDMLVENISEEDLDALIESADDNA